MTRPKGIDSSSPTQQNQYDNQPVDDNTQASFGTKEVKKNPPSLPVATTADQGSVGESTPSSLQERTVTPRLAPHLTAAEERGLLEKFTKTLNPKGFHECWKLGLQHPWLLRAHPQALLNRDPVSQATVLHALVIKQIDSDNLLQLLQTPQGVEAIGERNFEGATPLHHLAFIYPNFANWADKITPKDIFLTTDFHGSTPLHYASADNCKKLIEIAPKSLLVRNNRGVTPFNLMMRDPTTSLEEKQELLTLASRVEGFIDTLTDIKNTTSGIPEIDQRVWELIKAQPKPAIGVTLDQQAIHKERERQAAGSNNSLAALDLATPGPNKTDRPKIVDELDLASAIGPGNAKLEESARALLAGLGRVGVSGVFQCFPEETKDNIVSLGDENASLQLVKKLASLGAPNIQLRLSPPDLWKAAFPSNMISKKDQASRSTEENRQLQEMQNVTLHKLALLLPESNFQPEKGLPQTIKLGNSTIHVVGFEDSVKDQLQLEIGFSGALYRDFKTTSDTPNHYLTIRPYRFDSMAQLANLDIQQGQNNPSPLNLPPNSLLPEVPMNGPEGPDVHKGEKTWFNEMLKGSPGCHPKQAEQLADICALCRQGTIHTGMVYGIHHSNLALSGVGSTVLTRWLQAQEQRERPTMIFVHKSRMTPELEDDLEELGTPIIDLGQESAQTWLSNVHNSALKKDSRETKEQACVCLIPNLPKSAFQHLINTTDLPVLAEGANTVSHLLETGHPYLSVLPQGQTPIPYEMGYPLEAMKAEIYSYKLQLSEIGITLLETLHNQVEQGQYDQALAFLEKKRAILSSQTYLYTDENSQDATGRRKVTVQGLLHKGQQGRLGTIERAALLSALDPSPAAISAYIEDCMGEESITRDHFSLQKQHINQSFNDSVLVALSRFAKLKKLDI